MTLLEVLVTMLILSVSLLMLLSMAMFALNGNHRSNNMTVATQLMQQKLEEIRGSGNFGSGVDTVENVRIEWTVTAVAVHLRQVSITAAWRQLDGQERTHEMTALIKSDAV